MAKLNKKNKDTEKIIHIMVTSLCNRKCPDCCNNQYDLNSIPYVTDEELNNAEAICITGGEPFAYSNPCAIAYKLKSNYPNIKKIYVYSNADELVEYLAEGGSFYSIDGITVSVKNRRDKVAWEVYLLDVYQDDFLKLPSNRLYVFPGFEDVKCPQGIPKESRVWQKEFVAAPDSIFRKL